MIRQVMYPISNCICVLIWLRRWDSNPRLLAYEANDLTTDLLRYSQAGLYFATPRSPLPLALSLTLMPAVMPARTTAALAALPSRRLIIAHSRAASSATRLAHESQPHYEICTSLLGRRTLRPIPWARCGKSCPLPPCVDSLFL